MKVFYKRSFPPKKFQAINLFGIVVARKDGGKLSKHTINHEKIHSRQMIELFGIFFYLLYIAEWFFRLIQYRNKLMAYYNISFEREAYKYGNDLAYLENRKPYAFIKFYKKR